MLLLTGATGFIGRHLLARLRKRGERVRCLLLPGEQLNGAATPGVEVVHGDVTDLASLLGASASVETVIHCASAMLPNNAERIHHVNVTGTRNVIAYARQTGARRLIYLSAVSAVYRTKNVYGASKAAAEALVADSGLQFTILRPTMVYGRDGGLHFQRLLGLLRRAPRLIPVLGSGRARLQPVWVDDVVRAVELALDVGAAANKIYGVGGASVVTFDAYVDLLSEVVGRRPPLKVHVPLALCTAVARMVDPLIGPTFFSPAALRGLNEDATVDTESFARECGYAPVPLEAGLRAALRDA